MPKDDFIASKRSPVLNCVVMYNGKILLVQRNENLRLYPGVWNGISGFLDEPRKTVTDKAREELHEELGIPEREIITLNEGESFEREDPEYGKTWIIHPVFAEVSTDEVTLNGEEQNYVWVEPDEARQYELMPDFDKVLDTFSL